MPTLYQKADDMSILYNIEKFPSILGRYLGTGKPILFCLHMHVDVRIAEGNTDDGDGSNKRRNRNTKAA